MSQEAVTILTALEERIRRQRADAAAKARETVAAAIAQGEQMVDDAAKRAENEISVLQQQTKAAAEAAAREKAAQLADKEAALRATAEARSAAAIALITERIVNG